MYYNFLNKNIKSKALNRILIKHFKNIILKEKGTKDKH